MTVRQVVYLLLVNMSRFLLYKQRCCGHSSNFSVLADIAKLFSQYCCQVAFPAENAPTVTNTWYARLKQIYFFPSGGCAVVIHCDFNLHVLDFCVFTGHGFEARFITGLCDPGDIT